jgi:hypothetical protein
MLEAKLIGFKEGLKIAVIGLVFYSCLLQKGKKGLMKPFNLGIAASVIISIIIFLVFQDAINKQILTSIIATSFAFFLVLSAASLLHASGTNLFRLPGNADSIPHGPSPSGQSFFSEGAAGWIIVFFAVLIFFIPDSIGSLLFLKELAFIKGVEVQPYVYAFAGFLIPFIIMYLVARFYRPYWIGKFFDLPQFLLFLAIVKLLGSGIKGIAELSLIPSVQRGFMKFVHDFVHQTLVLFLIPDHPILKTTVWDFIGVFFGADLASFASLIILLFFPLMFIYFGLFKPLPEPEAQTNVQRRKIKSVILSDRRKKALPVFVFTAFVLTAWFSQRGETVSQIYEPVPTPVIVEKGMVSIPRKVPGVDLMNGMLHKFSLVHEGEEIRIIVIKKPGKGLSVALDACEICPPDGYGQREDHLVCLYCSTPLHIDTLGHPGGCNPIPLGAWIDVKNINVKLEEVLDKWGYVKAGKGKEQIK